jgi:hypothetical protein
MWSLPFQFVVVASLQSLFFCKTSATSVLFPLLYINTCKSLTWFEKKNDMYVTWLDLVTSAALTSIFCIISLTFICNRKWSHRITWGDCTTFLQIISKYLIGVAGLTFYCCHSPAAFSFTSGLRKVCLMH